MGKPIINIKFFADLKQFSSQMDNVGRDLEKRGKQFEKIGKKLSLNLTAPILALGGVSIAVFGKFEQELAKVEAISGATASEFAALKKNAEDLGASTRFTATEVAGLQLSFSKLGFDPGQIIDATESTLALAQATGEDLSKSATIAASTIKAFQLSAADTGRVTDVMAKSFSRSALNLEKFSVAMSTVAPVANTAKQSIEDTTGFLSVLVNAGIDASTAGTGLRNIFLDVAKGGSTLDAALAKINNSSNKNATALALFGKRGATVATVLAENIDAARSFADEYRNAGGEARRMAGIMDDTLEGSLARLKSAVEGAAISFGEVMAPAIQSLVDVITEAVGKFKKLAPETKKFIVIGAGIAATIGPAIVVLGTFQRNLAALIPVLKSVGVLIAANPIGALAVVLGALAATVLVANSRLKSLTDATKSYAEVSNTAAKSIAREKAELDTLLAIAKDETLEKKERQKAIENLNRISPKYLSNLNLENINTEAAATATKNYVDALLLKAKVIAAEDKLVEVQKELLELQLGTNDAVKPGIWQSLSNVLKNAGNTGLFLASTAKTISENTEDETTALSELQGKLTEFLTTNASLVNSNTAVANSFKAVSTAAGGSVDRTPEVSAIPTLFNEGPNAQRELLRVAGLAVTEFEDRVNDINLEKGRTELQAFEDRQKRLAEVGKAVGGAVGGVFVDLGNRIAEGLGAAEGGFKAFIAGLIQTVTKLISILLSQTIATSIAGATTSAAGTGPGFIFTHAPFIAQAVGGVLSAFAAIPKFETGGVVGGSSFTGDRILARVNSGELILNTSQQKRLLGMMDPAGGIREVPFIASTLLEGSNIRIVLNRSDKITGRNG